MTLVSCDVNGLDERQPDIGNDAIPLSELKDLCDGILHTGRNVCFFIPEAEKKSNRQEQGFAYGYMEMRVFTLCA